ncbi:MAG: hypothetical protein LAO19_13515, partial [Acidobacteriia bacterium]|nr:hypothetical protein [Terriglobia bacterium]
GSRNYRSEIANINEAAVYVTGTAKREGSVCQRIAELHIEHGTTKNKYQLPHADRREYSIIDFSQDASSILLSEQIADAVDDTFRNMEIAVVPISLGELSLHNVWDILQWGECDATVYPQGFGSDGAVVLLARPSIWHGHPRSNCVSKEGLYAVNLAAGTVIHLPSDTDTNRFGKSANGPCQTCKADPDIVGACFTVHGRLGLYNGTPSYRIWRIGTDRMLGVHTEIVPEAVASRLTWENAAFGDFYVCPFTREKPGEMQFVCVESASRIIYKKW